MYWVVSTFHIVPFAIIALGIAIGVILKGRLAAGYGDKLAFIVVCILLIYSVVALIQWMIWEPVGIEGMSKILEAIFIFPFIVVLPPVAVYYGIKGFKKRTKEEGSKLNDGTIIHNKQDNK